jgi:hypothetical protein
MRNVMQCRCDVWFLKWGNKILQNIFMLFIYITLIEKISSHRKPLLKRVSSELNPEICFPIRICTLDVRCTCIKDAQMRWPQCAFLMEKRELQNYRSVLYSHLYIHVCLSIPRIQKSPCNINCERKKRIGRSIT